jgi:hypothetical protein
VATLRRLVLSRNPLGIGGARTLAAGPRPPMLHTLRLADADFDEPAASLLGKIGWLGELFELDLSGNKLGRGVLAIRNVVGEGLRVLSLASVGAERTEAAALARFWPQLVILDAGGNPITDAGLERFVTMKAAPALQTLKLRDCQLAGDGLELLATRAKCPRLRALELAGNQVDAKSLELLLRSPLVANLQALDLSRCDLDGDAVGVLARTPRPPKLARLDLRANVLSAALLLELADSESLRPVSLVLDGNPWTFPAPERERLAARFGATWYQHGDDA